MQRVQLYIQDVNNEYKLVDLFQDENISVTSTIQDVKDIGKVFTDYSQTFTVPASDTNNKIFRHFYNFNITGGAFDSRKKKQAKIEINYIPFRNGKIFLNSVKMKNNKAHAYDLTFYGETVSLKDLIGDDELTDLDYLNNYNHEYDVATVKSGFTDGLNLNSQTDSIIYPLITSEKRLFYHSGSIPDANNTSGNLYHASTPSSSRGLEYTDLKPAIRVMHIIEAIEDEYEISFTRDFFNIESNSGTPKSPAFYNLYMWLNGVEGEFSKLENSTYDNWRYDCTGYTFDSSSDDISEATFANGIVTITKSTSLPSYNIEVETTPGNDDTVFTVSFTEVDSNGDKIEDGEYYEITKGQYIGGATPQGLEVFNSSDPTGTKRFKLEYTSTEPLTFDSKITLQKATNGSLIDLEEVYDSTSISLSINIDLISENFRIMPKIKVIDILTGLFKMFNLTAYYIDDLSDSDYNLNDKPTIYIDTLDNYYSDAVNNKLGGLIDLDKHTDIKEHTVDSVLPFTDIEFKYAERNTLLSENHLEQFNEVFGDAEFNVRKEFLGKIDRGTKYQIDVPFSHMKYERLLDLNSAPSGTTRDTSIQWGYCASGDYDYESGTPPTGDYDPVTIEPLLFYAISENTGANKKINWISESSPVGIDTYWRPSNSNEDGNSTTPPAHTLNFDAEVDEWQNINYSALADPYDSLESQSLYHVFYRSYVESVFNASKRMFRIKAFLPANILVNYKLNDQIKLQDKMFRINSITTNLMTGESELELLNIFSNEIVE